jgi:hypothetical protein
MNKTTNDSINIACFYNCDVYKDMLEEELAYGHLIYDEVAGILDEYDCFDYHCVGAERLKGGIQVDIEIKLPLDKSEVEMTLRCYKGVILINRYEDVYETFSTELFWRTMFFNKRGSDDK